MRRRNVFFLSILLASLGAVLLHPATSWLARLQLKGAVGITNPAMTNADGLSKRSREIAAANPRDFDLAYAAALRQTGPLMNESRTGVAEGNGVRIPERLEALKAQFPNQPELYAHQLRYWTLGPMLLRHRDTENPRPLDPKQNRADIWVRAEKAAEQGGRLAPDNAYFPLMRAIALFAQNRDAAAYEALHTAANCPEYTDYIWQEATSFWRLSDAAHGEIGSLPKMAQMSAILFPHYANIRTAARIAVAEATRREKAGDIAGAVRLRHATAVIGSRLREQGTSLITNLVGTAIFHLAGKGSPGWKELVSGDIPEELRNQQVAERAERYAAYLKSVGAKEEARSYETGIWTSLQTKKLAKHISNDQIFGWNSLLSRVIRAGIAQTAGVLLLTNIGWLLLLGAGAVLLCHTRGIRTGEGLPVLAHLALWGCVIGIAGRMACIQANGINPVQSLINMASTGGTPDDANQMGMTLAMFALSVPVPVFTMLVLAIRAKLKRERVVVAVARGMRVVVPPVAALLSLLLVGLIFWTVRIEKENLARMHGMARDGEIQFYARAMGEEWPIVVQR